MNKFYPITAAVASFFFSSFTQAATFTVTSLADSGVGSLRAAIVAANAAAGADTIQFQGGLQGVISLTTGELLINDSLSIVGPGASRITLDANNASRVFRIENPNNQDKIFSISGLKVTRGRIAGATDDSGGGVFYEAGSIHAQITLSDMVFVGNLAGRKGGAVSVSGANLTLRDVDMSNNQAEGGYQPSGGALFFQRGLVTIERGLFIGNSAALNAGAIQMSSPGTSAVIRDTLVKDNTAGHTGGGISAGTMLGMSIFGSAFVGNSTGEPYGGGIYFSGVTDAGSAQNVIENSTFSGNVSRHQSGRGSALAIWSGNMTVRNSTFAFNNTGPTWEIDPAAGGAVWLNNGPTTKVVVQSSLFAGNTHGNGNTRIDLTRNISASGAQSVLDVSYSSFQSIPAANVISGANEANLLDTDPLLLPLTIGHGRNFIPAHPIPLNSPAVDAGSNPANLTTDQRGPGFPRAVDANACRRPLIARTDIGAYEFRADTIFCHGFDS